MIAEAALQWYQIFADLMEHAYRDGQPSALAAFEATGRAYLAFARVHPGHYIAMFESGISVNRTTELSHASQRAQRHGPRGPRAVPNIPEDCRPPASMFSAHIWAMSHGVVELFARNSAGAQSPYSPEDLFETGIGMYLRVSGALPPDG